MIASDAEPAVRSDPVGSSAGAGRWLRLLEVAVWAAVGILALADETLMVAVLFDFWSDRISALLA